jgi:hypothetical protein
MTGEADQLAAAITIAASKHLDALIQAASRGDKAASRELHRHIHGEIWRLLDDRLADYVAAHGLPEKGIDADKDTRNLALAFAVALRIRKGETRKAAIINVAEVAELSRQSVEATYDAENRKIADAWAKDPDKRRIMVAMAAPYLP